MATQNNYYSGQGSLYIAERDAVTGKAKGFLPLGNVPELIIAIETTNFEHKESETGQRTIDLVIVKEKKGTFTFKMENLNQENLALGLWGESAAVVGGSVMDEEVAIYEDTTGQRYQLAHPKVSAVVVKDETEVTTYVVDTDYTVDAENGMITAVEGGAIDAASASADIELHISYTYAGYTKLDAFTNVVAPERWLRFEGINTIDGSRVVVDIFRAQFSPLTDYGLLNEELGSGSMKGNILADTLRETGSQFFTQLKL